MGTSTKNSVPDKFPRARKEEAAFWAWLTNRYAVSCETLSELDEDMEKTDSKIILLTKEQIKKYVSKAFQEHKNSIAKELFEITKPKDDYRAIIRKSMRVGRGDYVELLYLKILRETSFSEILIEILSDPMKTYVKDLEDKYGGFFSDKIFHLFKLIESWTDDTPDPRSRYIEWNIKKIEEYSFEPLRKNLRESLMNYVLTELSLKISSNFFEDGHHPMFYEFEDEWRRKFENNFFYDIEIKPSVLKDTLSFELNYVSHTEIDEIKEKELFLKYGEREALSFLQKFHLGGAKSEDGTYKGISNKSGHELSNFWIGRYIPLGKYVITDVTSKEFKVEIDNDFLNVIINRYKDIYKELKKTYLIRKDIVDIRNSDKVDYDNYGFQLDKLISDVIDDGDLEDYNIVSNIFNISSVITDIAYLTNVGRRFIQGELSRYPVISFYIHSDLALLLPIIIKKHSIYELARKYKLNRMTEQSES